VKVSFCGIGDGPVLSLVQPAPAIASIVRLKPIDERRNATL
jgi:hypothetical protein